MRHALLSCPVSSLARVAFVIVRFCPTLVRESSTPFVSAPPPPPFPALPCNTPLFHVVATRLSKLPAHLWSSPPPSPSLLRLFPCFALLPLLASLLPSFLPVGCDAKCVSPHDVFVPTSLFSNKTRRLSRRRARKPQQHTAHRPSCVHFSASLPSRQPPAPFPSDEWPFYRLPLLAPLQSISLAPPTVQFAARVPPPLFSPCAARSHRLLSRLPDLMRSCWPPALPFRAVSLCDPVRQTRCAALRCVFRRCCSHPAWCWLSSARCVLLPPRSGRTHYHHCRSHPSSRSANALCSRTFPTPFADPHLAAGCFSRSTAYLALPCLSPLLPSAPPPVTVVSTNRFV
ncbi:hypothetical protein TRVL_09505 [Trypanosoma vivax]|nr:hypothetical protein TRVL_09505 [Trypanosoma vivax]